jgi:hypothetical protein
MEKLQNANGKITKCKWKKLKKPLNQRTFLIFITLDNEIDFFPLDNGKNTSKNIRKKLKKIFRGE